MNKIKKTQDSSTTFSKKLSNYVQLSAGLACMDMGPSILMTISKYFTVSLILYVYNYIIFIHACNSELYKEFQGSEISYEYVLRDESLFM